MEKVELNEIITIKDLPNFRIIEHYSYGHSFGLIEILKRKANLLIPYKIIRMKTNEV